MAALMLVCSTGQAQTYLKNSLKNLRKEAQKPENTAKVYHNPARYEEVSFITPNAEGQRLFYKILPENNHTVAIIRPEEKKDRYNDASYIIPSSVSYNGQTYTVTEIGTGAFYGTEATSITLPSTLKYIGALAFCDSNIEKVSLPSGTKAIGADAFRGSTQLYSVSFNEGLETIEGCAFFRTILKSITLPKSLKEVGFAAFAAKEYSVLELSIPESLKDIGEYAFAGYTTGLRFMFANYDGLITSLPAWITPNISEKYGLSPESVRIYIAQNRPTQQPVQQQVIYVQQPMAQAVPAATSARPTPSSDVDQNIPEAPTSNANTFAIIIANENYQKEVPVQYALNDGETFKNYCLKTLGLPEDNIHYIADATLNNMLAEVDWIAKVARAYNGEANLIVYYAGHGIPDEASGSSYLLPVDGVGNNLRTGYSLAELYKTLGALPAKSVTVFMDACFSGAKRGEGMLASARGVAIKAKPEAPKGNMVVFSAAQGDETAYPYEDKGHGLFTYFLLKKLQETKGQVSLGELAQYVQQQVSRRSIVTNGKSQTPCVTPSESVVGTWKGKMLK